jgi:hypothetical protein
MSTAPAPALPGVTFEVDRFEWTSDDRLEVVGRWFGLRGHRFLRPTLDVEVGGARRRMLAVLEHKPWAAEEGEEWVAAFAWAGDRSRLDDAELTVSPDLAVQLPLPDVEEPSAAAEDAGGATAAGAAERLPARRPRTAVLEGELAAALAQVAQRDEELARLRETHSEMTRELRDRAREAQEKATQLERELDEMRGQMATAEEHAKAEHQAAEEERSRQLESMREERDAATADRNRAEAEAEAALADRDEAQKKLAAAEAERAALEEGRDRAREERNAWMQRARAASAEARGKAPIAHRVPAPPPPSASPPPDPPRVEEAPTEIAPQPVGERRTIQIGERPGPLRAPRPPGGDIRLPGQRWTPRVIALVAIGVVLLVVLLLLLLAF